MKFKKILDIRNKKTDTFPVKIRISDSKEFYLHTGVSVTLKEWDDQIKKVVKHPDRNNYNDTIEQCLNRAKSIHYDNPKLSAKEVRDKATGEEREQVKTESFIDFATLLIKEAKAGVVKRSRETVRTYEYSLANLKKYKDKLTFDDINRDFYNGYVSHHRKLGNTDNTIGKEIKFIKSVMNEAVDRDLTTNTEHKKKYFAVFREEPENIFLSEREVKQIYNAKLSSPMYAQERDRFVLNCCIGVRIGDCLELGRHNIIKVKDREMLKVIMNKTGEEVVVPLSSMAKEILHKYNYNLPEITIQKANKYIKEVCKEAGLTDVIMINGKKVIKYTEATTHTARRSFATNGYLAGVPILTLMKLTGHKTMKSFMRYIRATSLEAAIAVSDHSFFK